MRPYEWQTKALHKFKDATACLINAACGAGKTLVAIWIGLHKKLPVVVICPKALTGQWKSDLMGEGVAEEDIFVFDQPTYSKNKKDYEERVDRWLKS